MIAEGKRVDDYGRMCCESGGRRLGTSLRYHVDLKFEVKA
jgi:hypothetical protein